MSNPGWFHRSGHGAGSVTWTPADTAGGPSPSLPHQPTPVTPSPPTGTFPVKDVHGNSPTDLSAFLGVTAFTVLKGNLTYRVFGTGHAHGDTVIFRQQDLGWDGRYIRTWTITTTPDGILAEPDTIPPPA